MDFSVETIKNDLKQLEEKEFLIKYLLKSDNWYFSEYQSQSELDSVTQMDILKEILNKSIGVAFHNILMVGSGKIGCSLSPDKEFKKFDDGDENSDIDIAIISSKLFDHLWEKIRTECSIKYIYQYEKITSSIFRGFINEHNFKNIDEIRPEWNARIDNTNKSLQKHLSIYHHVNYRIYRSWEDLEAYHILGIRKLKGKF
ncbi:hypothetical protein EZS27_025233 [termite gut metagenome]|uniref:Uncharacterized protein n=1 Tax=termite gut metagenome TaxID=433724 RepID=A0A5J4QWJ2_9ZZZZ